jgi:hypothetical protein
MPEVRECQECGGPFPLRKPGQRFCSLSCAARNRCRGIDERFPGWSDGTYKRKVCGNCGKPFDRRGRESPDEYYSRAFCSRECRFASQRTPEGRETARIRFLRAAERGIEYRMTAEEQARMREKMLLFLELHGISPEEARQMADEAPPLVPSTD